MRTNDSRANRYLHQTKLYLLSQAKFNLLKARLASDFFMKIIIDILQAFYQSGG